MGFEEGEAAMLKLRPHRQKLVASYKLELPQSSRIHPVYLKNALIIDLPAELQVQGHEFIPKDILEVLP